MAGHTTIKRDGGWRIELLNPVDKVEQIDIRPPNLDHTIRWTQQRIPSVLALLSELSGVKESTLVQLTGADIDRVLLAFSIMVPKQIKDDFDSGTRPLATREEDLTEEQRYERLAAENDPNDPRFPRIDGPVQPFKEEPPTPIAHEEPEPIATGPGIDANPKPIMRKVG